MNKTAFSIHGANRNYSTRRTLPAASGSIVDLGAIAFNPDYGVDSPFANFTTKQFLIRLCEQDQHTTSLFVVALGGNTGTAGAWLEVTPLISSSTSLTYALDIRDAGGSASSCDLRLRRKTTAGASTHFDVIVELVTSELVFLPSELEVSLIAAWQMGEASGTRVDSFGAHDLTNHGATQITGKVGNAVHCTRASSQYLERATEAALETGDIDFGFCTQLKLDSKPAAMYAFSKAHDDGDANNYDYGLVYVSGTDRLKWIVSDGSTLGVVSADSFGSPPTGSWLFVSCWHDSVNDLLCIQVNNGPVDSVSWTGGGHVSGFAFRVGGETGGTSYWDGGVDELYFYKRVPSVNDRSRLWNGGNGLAYPFSAGAGTFALTVGPETTANKDTDTTLAANSDIKYPSQKAVKSYVDQAVIGLLDFKAATNCSTNPNYPVASKGDAYVVSIAGKIGGAGGKPVDVGDFYIASADNAGGTEAGVGTSWFVLEHNLQGALLSANNLSDLASSSTARSSLGLVIGTDVEAHDPDLTTIAGLSPANDDFMQRKAGGWVNRTVAQVKVDLSVRPYTIYAARLTQAGSSNPSVTVLENTTGLTFVWTRLIAGVFDADVSGGGSFVSSKVFPLVQKILPVGTEMTFTCNPTISTTKVRLAAWDSGNNLVDGCDVAVEFRIYP